MKKIFIEPDIQRLNVNLQENIASSGCSWPVFFFLSNGGISPVIHNLADLEAQYRFFEATQDLKNANAFLDSLGTCVFWVSRSNQE